MRIIRLKKRSNFFNKKTTINGHTFDSKKEAARYQKLVLLERANEIRNLICHPIFMLQAGFKDNMGSKHRSITYSADFQYYDNNLKKTVIEDVKCNATFRTETYKIKKKLFLKTLQTDQIFVEVY